MKHIAYVFTNGDSWMSKAIRLQTWGDVNHTAFEFVEDGVLIQIQSPKVIEVPPAVLIERASKTYRFVLPVEDEVYEKTLAWARANIVGKNYDIISVARFLLPLRDLLGRLKSAVRKASRDWFCAEGSEVLGRKCEQGLIRTRIDPARISPQKQFESKILEKAVVYQEYQKGELIYSGPYQIEDI